jgi:hypothetical protein
MQVRSENLLRERASFDFSCPRGELLLTRLHWDFHGWSGRTSATYGVAGCGRQATYVLADADTWVMDTSRTTAPAPQWAPVPAYPPVAAAPWPPPEAPVSVPPPIASIATVVVVAPPATDTTVMPPAEGLPESPSRSDVEAGRCVAGREPPREGPLESCWDTEETYLADGGRVQGITQEHLRGVTPLVVYGAAAPGTLRITVEWSPYCDDCRLEISEHNSGMASLVEGTRRREGPVEEIALPATPGPYYLVGRRAGPSVPFLVVATLVRADGLPAASTLHGVSWQRRCED